MDLSLAKIDAVLRAPTAAEAARDDADARRNLYRLAANCNRRGLVVDRDVSWEWLMRMALRLTWAPRDPLPHWQCIRARHGLPCDGGVSCGCNIPY